MILLLYMMLFGHEILWLGSGQKLVCERYRVSGDKVIVHVKGQRFSIDPGTVDWIKTRLAAEHEEPEPDDGRLPGGKWGTQIENLPAAEEPEQEPITDLVIDKLSVKDADLVELLRFMADMAGINMVIDGSVPNAKATYHFKNIAWDDAFHIILENANLAFEDLHGAVRIKPY